MTLYFEDFTHGRVFELGSVTVTEDEIIEFAGRYDPQPFHTDPAAAADSIFGGVIASGWHTCAMFMRLMVDQLLSDSTSMGSPGMDEIRWATPVRPGDTLTGATVVIEARESRSKPDRGIVRLASRLHNQHGDEVLSMTGMGLYGRRPS